MTPKERVAMQQALEALEIYGEHAKDCPQYPTYTRPQDYPKCDCGYEEAVTALREALAEQAEQKTYPVRRGSRITCIESGEKCVVWATSHTDCWVQFPDGHAGQYTYEQIGSLFSLAEQAEQEPVAEILVNDDDVIVLWHKTARQLGHKAKLYAAPVSIEAAVLAEREVCANVCDGISQGSTRYDCAAAIRARGENEC